MRKLLDSRLRAVIMVSPQQKGKLMLQEIMDMASDVSDEREVDGDRLFRLVTNLQTELYDMAGKLRESEAELDAVLSPEQFPSRSFESFATDVEFLLG